MFSSKKISLEIFLLVNKGQDRQVSGALYGFSYFALVFGASAGAFAVGDASMETSKRPKHFAV